MRLFKLLIVSSVFCLIFAFAGGVTVHAADSLDFLSELLSEGVVEGAGTDNDGTESAGVDGAAMGVTAKFGDTVSFTLPSDWTAEAEAEGIEDCCFTFKGMDKNGLEVYFIGMVFDTEDSGNELYKGGLFEKEIRTYADLAEALARNGMIHSSSNHNGIDVIFLSDWEAIGGFILDQNRHIYVFAFMSEQYMYPVRESSKLRSDMAGILQSMKAIDADNLMYFDEAASAFEPVSFHGDEEFERMVRSALGKTENVPVYASELAAVRDLAIVEGSIGFVKSIKKNEDYDQPGVLHLENLRLFPNLETLNIDHMECKGYEVLSELSNLRSLKLNRTGIRELGFLQNLTLHHLSLIENRIIDFAPIASVKDLESLNLAFTGLESLELLRGLDLRELYVSGNPITDLSPISGMKRLEVLHIRETRVRSLEALRGLDELRELNIQELGEQISLEPLHSHAKLEVIYSGGTKVVDAEGLDEVLKDWIH